MFSTSSASPSVITSAGSNVAFASRPPIVGQRADRVGEDLAVAAEALGDRDRAHLGAGRRAAADVAASLMRTACLVLGFGHVDVLGAELVPRLVALRGRGVLALERFVALDSRARTR